MNRQTLEKYERTTVRLKYTKGTGVHSQVGILYAVGIYHVLFWPTTDENEAEDVEYPIKMKDIKNIWQVKGVNE